MKLLFWIVWVVFGGYLYFYCQAHPVPPVTLDPPETQYDLFFWWGLVSIFNFFCLQSLAKRPKENLSSD
jgi:hypothetical protein